MNEITLEVPGVPAPGGSKRHIGGGRMIDDCKRNPGWRSIVAWTARMELRGMMPLEGALAVDVVFWMPRPKAHYGTGKNAGKLKPNAPKYHTVKPDGTKLWRSTEDALTGLAWRDDAAVADQRVRKLYGETPGAEIRVWTLVDDNEGRIAA